MPTDLSRPDPLIDRLVAELAPVQPRRWWREAMLLGVAVLLEALVVAQLVGVRGDMQLDLAGTMMAPAFMWKTAFLTLVATLGTGAALLSLDPAAARNRQTAQLWTALGLLLPVALAIGWLIDAGTGSGARADGWALLAARLDWHDGVDCTRHVVMMGVPLLLLLTVIVRRGAATQPHRTAAAAGLAAAGLGAVGFMVSCPHDDPLYVAVWYGLGMMILLGLARLVLPRLTRW